MSRDKRKRGKSSYKAQKHNRPDFKPLEGSILYTCDGGRENNAGRDLINLINSKFERKEEEASETKEDISSMSLEDQIKAELAQEMAKGGKADSWFERIDMGRGFGMLHPVSTPLPADVMDIVFSLFEEVRTRRAPVSRFAFKISPLQVVSSSRTLSKISGSLSSLLTKLTVDPALPRTFFVQYKRRYCEREMAEFLELESESEETPIVVPEHSATIRDAIYHEIQRLLGIHFPSTDDGDEEEGGNTVKPWRNSFKTGTIVIVIELYKNWCGLSALLGSECHTRGDLHLKKFLSLVEKEEGGGEEKGDEEA